MLRPPADSDGPVAPGTPRAPGPVSSLERLTLAVRYAQNHPWRVGGSVLAVVVAVVVTWRVMAVPAAGAPEANIPLATRSPVTTSSSIAARGAEVVVHVAGAVASPGVYRLSEGARTIDAISAAGGARVDADLVRVNLATRLSDGLRVYVPAVGEIAPPVVEGAAGSERAGPLDLNVATADQLDDLPGIGPATAAAIIAYRRDHGPFSSVEQLLEVRGIGPSKLEQIRSLVAV